MLAGMSRQSATFPSPLGPLTLVEEDGHVVALTWGAVAEGGSTPLLEEAGRQLAEYFARRRQAFDLPIRLEGGFQGQVQRAMLAIPQGETRTYGDLAKALGAMPQSIGQACGANRLPILVPCHRVLGAQGLGGYSGAGGIETKVWLLRHEGAGGLLI